MRLPRKLSDCVMFAKWCEREKQRPESVARLLVLARKAKNLGEHYCNTGQRPRYEKAMADFENLANELGYNVDWPGLWPTLRNARIDSTYDIYLPEIS